MEFTVFTPYIGESANKLRTRAVRQLRGRDDDEYNMMINTAINNPNQLVSALFPLIVNEGQTSAQARANMGAKFQKRLETRGYRGAKNAQVSVLACDNDQLSIVTLVINTNIKATRNLSAS